MRIAPGELAETSGFVMRVIHERGQQVFEVQSVDTGVKIDPREYEPATGMQIIDMDEKIKAISKRGQQMVQQMPQNCVQMTPEMQQQMPQSR